MNRPQPVARILTALLWVATAGCAAETAVVHDGLTQCTETLPLTPDPEYPIGDDQPSTLRFDLALEGAQHAYSGELFFEEGRLFAANGFQIAITQLDGTPLSTGDVAVLGNAQLVVDWECKYEPWGFRSYSMMRCSEDVVGAPATGEELFGKQRCAYALADVVLNPIDIRAECWNPPASANDDGFLTVTVLPNVPYATIGGDPSDDLACYDDRDSPVVNFALTLTHGEAGS